jgi:hypothetical protein
MRKALVAIFPAAVILITAPSGFAASPANYCPEGRTFSGTCVNVAQAKANRARAIAFTQVELSKTSPPRLPSDDRKYMIPFNYFELLRVLLQ